MARGRRKAEAVLGADTRKLDRDLRNARSKFMKFGRGVTNSLKRSFGGISRTVGGVLGVGAGASVAVVGRQVFDLEKRLTRFRIAAELSGDETQAFRDSLFASSKQLGLLPEQVLSGAEKLQALVGDTELTKKSMFDLGRVAAATGADMADISSVAAAASGAFGLSGEGLNGALAVLIKQGKAGSVEFAELGQHLAKKSPGF